MGMTPGGWGGERLFGGARTDERFLVGGLGPLVRLQNADPVPVLGERDVWPEALGAHVESVLVLEAGAEVLVLSCVYGTSEEVGGGPPTPSRLRCGGTGCAFAGGRVLGLVVGGVVWCRSDLAIVILLVDGFVGDAVGLSDEAVFVFGHDVILIVRTLLPLFSTIVRQVDRLVRLLCLVVAVRSGRTGKMTVLAICGLVQREVAVDEWIEIGVEVFWLGGVSRAADVEQLLAVIESAARVSVRNLWLAGMLEVRLRMVAQWMVTWHGCALLSVDTVAIVVDVLIPVIVCTGVRVLAYVAVTEGIALTVVTLAALFHRGCCLDAS